MENENNYYSNVPVEKKGMSTASLVLGIVSVVLMCFSYVSLPCAVLAIIFGVLGKQKGGAGMAKAGLILGIITVSIFVVCLIIALITGAALGSLGSFCEVGEWQWADGVTLN